MPIVGLIAETIIYLLTLIIAIIVITSMVGFVVTEFSKVIAPSGHAMLSKAELTLSKYSLR
jgi:hypothetical protein